MPPVHAAEGVADVKVGQGRETIREGPSLGVVPAGLARAETQVLQQEYFARTERGCSRRPAGPAGSVSFEARTTGRPSGWLSCSATGARLNPGPGRPAGRPR
jgi:hypothetical protein